MSHMKNILLPFLAIIILAIASSIKAYIIDIDYSGFSLEKKENGVEIYKSRDGSVIKKYPDKEEAIYSDGTKIKREKDGSREITTPDGTKISIARDGSAKYKFSDGSEKSLSMDGYTHYGLKIDDVKKSISYEDYTAEIVYSGKLSDEILDKNILLFYNEFVYQMQTALTSKKSAPDYKMKIEISNCRYCKTGYCARNNKKQFEIIYIKNDNIVKRISLSYAEVSHPQIYAETAKRAADQIFSDH